MTFRACFASILIASLVAVPLAVPQPADAAASSADDGKRKINLSGRQRMLSQRMAKAVCFAAMGVDRDAHLKMAADAHALFDRTLAGLRSGDAEMGLTEEKAPEIVAELDLVDQLWERYGEAVETAAGGTDDPAVFDTVATMNVPTLSQMNKAVTTFEKRYGASDIHPSLALALNVSGRQRMLSQKASKEFCLVLHGYEADANRAALKKTVELFESSLAALSDGDDAMGMPEAPTDEIYDQLEHVGKLWAPLSAIFATVIGGGTPSQDDVAFVAGANNKVLVEMNRAVLMYEDL